MSSSKAITPGNSRQITLSAKAGQHLGLNKGAQLAEIVVGNCVILVSQNRRLVNLMKSAQKELSDAGITVEELKAEVERQKNKRFARQYPNLFK